MDKFVTILCIVNDGFSTEVMDAAKKCGARGGTVLHGRGTASKDAEKIFNISIQPEKEVVVILVNENIKKNVLNELYNAVGANTPAQGFVFTLPVDEVAGIGPS
jgi:nitrogen regulatory protein PII